MYFLFLYIFCILKSSSRNKSNESTFETGSHRKPHLVHAKAAAASSSDKRPTDKLAVYDLQRFASAENEGRTELPSERRKREERDKGNVVRSQEIVSAAILFGGALVLFILGVYMISSIQKMFQSYLEMDFRLTQNIGSFEGTREFLFGMTFEVAKITGPMLIVAFIMAIISNVSQFGLLFSLHPLGWRWEKIKPDFRRVFPGKRTLFTLFRTLSQLVFIAIVAYIIVINDYTTMLKVANMDLNQAISLFAFVAFKLLAATALILALVSIPDFFYQRHEYLEKLKVTSSEAKRERKEEEGDPIVRQRQRDRTYELRKQRDMLQDVNTADVVVANPTHFAVALKYEPGLSPAPIVTAKGADHLAFLIRNIAKENKIPIEENPPLARALYEDVEVGQEIPETLYRVVSLIFAKLNRFRQAGVGNA